MPNKSGAFCKFNKDCRTNDEGSFQSPREMSQSRKIVFLLIVERSRGIMPSQSTCRKSLLCRWSLYSRCLCLLTNRTSSFGGDWRWPWKLKNSNRGGNKSSARYNKKNGGNFLYLMVSHRCQCIETFWMWENLVRIPWGVVIGFRNKQRAVWKKLWHLSL